jgi:hypothetical protein
LTETNGVPVPQLKQFSGLEYNKPAEWIIEHNTCDSSNNCAEPVKFTVIFRDTQAPVIDTTPLSTIPSTMAAGGKSSVFEAPKTTAVDNMDGVVPVSIAPSTVSTYAAGSRKIVYSAHDYAGVFGKNGNNVATIVKEFNVIDTTPPTITITGDSSVTQQCGTLYSDAGAKCQDVHDGSIVVKSSSDVNTKNVGIYTIQYTCEDSAANEAQSQSRTVNVHDTTAPSITYSGDQTIQLVAGAVSNAETLDGFESASTCTDSCDTEPYSSAQFFHGSCDFGTLATAEQALLPGTYAIKYTCADGSGNALSKCRTVYQVEPTLHYCIEAKITFTSDNCDEQTFDWDEENALRNLLSQELGVAKNFIAWPSRNGVVANPNGGVTVTMNLRSVYETDALALKSKLASLHADSSDFASKLSEAEVSGYCYYNQKPIVSFHLVILKSVVHEKL